MRQHKILLKSGTALHEKYGQEFYAYLSRVDVANGKFYVLTQTDIGVLGEDGTEIPFSDCTAVYCEGTRSGVFDSDEQISRWLQWHSTSGLYK